MSGVRVRHATPADIPAMSRVLIASITELCGADHGGDPTLIADWTANKTPESVARWFDNPDNTLYVAERLGEVAAVGSTGPGGEIRVNYVAPTHRFTGVSRTLLAAMEEALRRQGLAEARLHSTRTAHSFYLARGWEDAGELDLSGRVPGFPMRKRL